MKFLMICNNYLFKLKVQDFCFFLLMEGQKLKNESVFIVKVFHFESRVLYKVNYKVTSRGTIVSLLQTSFYQGTIVVTSYLREKTIGNETEKIKKILYSVR